MNQIAATVLTDQANPSAETTEAITAFMFELMAAAEQRGDIEVGMNALLGAYMNLAQKSRTISVGKSAAALVTAGRAMAAADHLLKPNATAQPAGGQADVQGLDPATLADAKSLAGKLHFQLVGQRHETALTALISVFRRVALEFSCCTETCGQHCLELGKELLGSSSAGHREPGTQVH